MSSCREPQAPPASPIVDPSIPTVSITASPGQYQSSSQPAVPPRDESPTPTPARVRSQTAPPPSPRPAALASPTSPAVFDDDDDDTVSETDFYSASGGEEGYNSDGEGEPQPRATAHGVDPDAMDESGNDEAEASSDGWDGDDELEFDFTEEVGDAVRVNSPPLLMYLPFGGYTASREFLSGVRRQARAANFDLDQFGSDLDSQLLIDFSRVMEGSRGRSRVRFGRGSGQGHNPIPGLSNLPSSVPNHDPITVLGSIPSSVPNPAPIPDFNHIPTSSQPPPRTGGIGINTSSGIGLEIPPSAIRNPRNTTPLPTLPTHLPYLYSHSHTHSHTHPYPRTNQRPSLRDTATFRALTPREWHAATVELIGYCPGWAKAGEG
ncbi:hypothetical protein C8A05DRAFT_36464 [Staphylotrichum tortipilum]|uniref:Uncharacterized protein n=1 Tax=Staphylotrichum tortipilum TaxID=2831512 RepID=A0AAN6MGR3_9PEZI|nr:hypothetical protein C8A05DRAFT_36464 [Staphylotrichum longicolle]